jgi:hypothetical protein
MARAAFLVSGPAIQAGSPAQETCATPPQTGVLPGNKGY